MSTLQAADPNQFDSTVESSVQLTASNPQANTVSGDGWPQRMKRLRGYVALGTLFIVTLSGYAGLFVLFDRLVAVGSSG